MKFEIKDADYGKSPYTGMTRKHWLEACEFLLDGIFSNLSSMDDQPLSPRTEFHVSYPNAGSSPTKASAERFEGLARSFLIAAPLLHNRPESVIRGFSVGEYYKQHILQAMTPGNANYLLNLKELQINEANLMQKQLIEIQKNYEDKESTELLMGNYNNILYKLEKL